MIVKGASRGAPKRLAAHLRRTDTNGRVSILELQSPHDSLKEAFRDWQFLAGGTRGSKGLYHANIDPHTSYPMTEKQWRRAADILEKELGLEGHPRAIVLHEKKGRQHIHVVWQRTNSETMTLASDSWNYRAHERASARMEEEFGHERVPGKHDKRDRSLQPEFPQSKVNHAEWQQGERSGLDPVARKDAITDLYRHCDSGKAFHAALEKQGYILARGDRRDFVIVDRAADVLSLGRQVQGVRAKELRAFMADVKRASLPDVDQARALQRQQERARQGGDRSQGTDERARKPPHRPDTADVVRALKERHKEERKKLRETQAGEVAQLRRVLARERKEKLDNQKALQGAERRRLRERQQKERRGVVAAMKRRMNRKRAKQQDVARLRARHRLADRQKQERADLRARLTAEARAEILDLKDRHAQKLREDAQRYGAERKRYLQEEEAARRLLEEQEKRAREKEKQRARDGPRRPRGRAR